MFKLRFTCQKGFALVEILLALAIFGMLASALAPSMISQAQTRAAKRLIAEVSDLHNAAKAYYVKQNQWPSSIDDLINAGYLPTGWAAENPFGGYYSFSNNGIYFTVAAAVPSAVADGIARNLPLTTVSGSEPALQVASSASMPGQMADLSALYDYVDQRVNYVIGEWIPQNIKIEYPGTKYIGWWSNYNAFRPGYLYGNKMQTNMVNLKVADNEYELGLTIPTSGTVTTRYQWNPDNPGAPLYVNKSW